MKGPLTGVAVVAVAAVTLVTLTLRQPDVPTYAPTRPEPRDAGPARVGPVLYTVDATSPDDWTYFSFRLGSVVTDPGPVDWDLAFRRFRILANGGRGFAGGGGILDLGPVPFNAVAEVPDAEYVTNEGVPDPSNAAVAQWYRYGFFSHVLTPKPHVWAVRTADGRYAKLEILSYYCEGGRPGCFTFRYVYQGGGSRTVARAQAPAGIGHPSHSQRARPMIHSRSCADSQESSSVNSVTAWRHGTGSRVQSVPQNIRCGPKASYTRRMCGWMPRNGYASVV